MNNSFKRYHLRHEHALREYISHTSIPAARIKEAILYTLFPGGKRLRPLLVYLCGELVGVNIQSLDAIALAVELMHAYSLVHDDLPAMDNDDFRRGRPSCHRAFDEATAILVGDALQALAIDVLLTQLPSSQPSDQIIKITHTLITASGPAGMISGQCLDLSELDNPNLAETQLRTIHQLKTGKLISACIHMVLAAGSTSTLAANALSQFANHLGLLFQMQDDYLDRYSNTTLGKNRASDLANQKITFANLYDKASLLALIDQLMQQTEHALTPFEQNSFNLLTLLQGLYQRLDP